MITKLLDLTALLAAAGAAYYHYWHKQPAFDLTAVILAIISITVFGLSSAIKDNFVDFLHALIALAFGYFIGPMVAGGYIVCIVLFSQYRPAQLVTAALFSFSVLFLTA